MTLIVWSGFEDNEDTRILFSPSNDNLTIFERTGQKIKWYKLLILKDFTLKLLAQMCYNTPACEVYKRRPTSVTPESACD